MICQKYRYLGFFDNYTYDVWSAQHLEFTYSSYLAFFMLHNHCDCRSARHIEFKIWSPSKNWYWHSKWWELSLHFGHTAHITTVIQRAGHLEFTFRLPSTCRYWHLIWCTGYLEFTLWLPGTCHYWHLMCRAFRIYILVTW